MIRKLFLFILSFIFGVVPSNAIGPFKFEYNGSVGDYFIFSDDILGSYGVLGGICSTNAKGEFQVMPKIVWKQLAPKPADFIEIMSKFDFIKVFSKSKEMPVLEIQSEALLTSLYHGELKNIDLDDLISNLKVVASNEKTKGIMGKLVKDTVNALQSILTYKEQSQKEYLISEKTEIYIKERIEMLNSMVKPKNNAIEETNKFGSSSPMNKHMRKNIESTSEKIEYSCGCIII